MRRNFIAGFKEVVLNKNRTHRTSKKYSKILLQAKVTKNNTQKTKAIKINNNINIKIINSRHNTNKKDNRNSNKIRSNHHLATKVKEAKRRVKKKQMARIR